MKSRGMVVCEHCKVPVSPGTQVSRYAGRLWRTDHLIEYRRKRGARQRA
jgi:hypothetical protein